MDVSKIAVGYILERFANGRRRTFALGVCLLLFELFLQRVPALFIGVALDALPLDVRS